MNEELLYDKDEHVAHITLNRPRTRNAWSELMIQGVHEALDDAERDPQIRAVILTGAGKAFCAGGDLRAMSERSGMFAGDTVELRRAYSRGLQDITRHFDRFEKPVIAAINGAAIGAGLDLSLMCDIRIASTQAKFGSTFASVGLVPGDGGAYLLTRTVGFSRAVELILTARVFDAAEALELGVVHHTVPSADIQPRAATLAREIAELPPKAVQMAKVALYRTAHQDLESALQLTSALQSLVQHTDEHLTAVATMLAKLGRND